VAWNVPLPRSTVDTPAAPIYGGDVIPRSLQLIRRVLAPTLAALCFASTVVAPLLDADDQGHGSVLESKHDASTCLRGHDHTICTQVGANAGATTSFVRHRVGTHAQRVCLYTLNERLAHSAASFLPLGSRAPPLA
jgi:hypothetical protein